MSARSPPSTLRRTVILIRKDGRRAAHERLDVRSPRLIHYRPLRNRGSRYSTREGGSGLALDDQAQIESLVVDLTKEFENAVGSDKIRDEVISDYQRFDKAPIRQFVPVLTRRIAREELRGAM
jgi:hypothetical protein